MFRYAIATICSEQNLSRWPVVAAINFPECSNEKCLFRRMVSKTLRVETSVPMPEFAGFLNRKAAGRCGQEIALYGKTTKTSRFRYYFIRIMYAPAREFIS